MQPSDGTVILCMMVVAAIAITLVYDLITNVRRASRRPASPAPEPAPFWVAPLAQVAAGMTPLAKWLPAESMPMSADLHRLTVPPLSLPAGPPTASTREAEALHDLTARLTALRLIGLDHLRDVHPMFRLTTDEAGLILPPAALPLEPSPEPEITPARARSRRRPNPLTLARATGQLRLVSDTTRWPPV